MTPGSLIISGTILGFSIAAPVGPMGLLCINRTLSTGVWTGVSTGAGASTVQVLYCGILLSGGLDWIAAWLNENRNVMTLIGAAGMLFFACRLLSTRRHPAAERLATKRSLFMAYATAALLNLTNPMGLLLIISGVAIVVHPGSADASDTRLLLAGQFLGSITWWICLSAGTAALRSRMTMRLMGMIDKTIATTLAGFGAAAVARVVCG